MRPNTVSEDPGLGEVSLYLSPTLFTIYRVSTLLNIGIVWESCEALWDKSQALPSSPLFDKFSPFVIKNGFFFLYMNIGIFISL